MGSDYTKPLPELSDENAPFWRAADDGVLRLQQCSGCKHLRYPIAQICPECLDERFEWADMSGQATVFSYIVFHQVYSEAFRDDVPYNVAIVELDEGPRLISNIIEPAGRRAQVGDRVVLTWVPATDDISIPKFTLQAGQGAD